MSFFDKFVSILDYSIVKKIVFRGNRSLFFGFVATYLISVLAFVLYVWYNGGQYIIYESGHSFVNVKVNRAIRTNYTYDKFNQSYIKSEDLSLYNRVWVGTDYADVEKINRALIFTNIIIAPNQTLSSCPEHPCVAGAICDPSKAGECRPEKIMSRGIQTGKCIRADFPSWNSTERKTSYGFTCEKEGWCPTNRYYMPLNQENPLLKDTKNSLLYIKIALPFPDFNLTLVNDNQETMRDVLNCRWHPINKPYCQFYLLDDVVKFTSNMRQTYDGFAKYGGTISIDISWDCTMPLISKFDWIRDCEIKFKLIRLDNQYEQDKLGPKSYTKIFAFDNNRRTFWRIYGIEIGLNPHGSLRVFSWYKFISAVGALLSFAFILPCLFEKIIRYKYGHLNLNEIVDCDNHANWAGINNDYEALSDDTSEHLSQNDESESTRLIERREFKSTDNKSESSFMLDTSEPSIQTKQLELIKTLDD